MAYVFDLSEWPASQLKAYYDSVEFVNTLFVKRSRLLVVKIVLSFAKDSVCRTDPREAALCFNRFRNNSRGNKLFGFTIGYLWSLSHGEKTGYYFSLVILFDGARRRKAMSIGKLIGQYWNTTVNRKGTYYSDLEKGTYFCSNYFNTITKMEKQGTLGIGMIHRNDLELRRNLNEYVISHLHSDNVKTLIYLTKHGHRQRVIGRGRNS
jgi:hypothetical protein